jgi:DNA replication licensing factor MCM3
MFHRLFSKKILSAQFLRKYLHMAKNIKPVLSEAASNYITEQYSELRSIDLSKTDCERVRAA